MALFRAVLAPYKAVLAPYKAVPAAYNAVQEARMMVADSEESRGATGFERAISCSAIGGGAATVPPGLSKMVVSR